MTGVFLQVRLDSSRLPRKAVALLGKLTVTEHCLMALKAVKADVYVLVTEPDSAPTLLPFVEKYGWQLFSGSKLNVLDRFVQAARRFQVQTIVRATGDNPLVSADLANQLLVIHQDHHNDYSAFDGAPLGSGVEILNVAALEKAWANQPDQYEQEHASPYLYRRPEQFRIERLAVSPALNYAQGRITIDTVDDLTYMQALFRDLYRGQPLALEEFLPWLKNHPYP